MKEGGGGTLFLCATPIGNLEDITFRVLRVLREVDLIAAEDTRRTRKLLSYYDIHTPLTSYNEHNHRHKAAYLLDQIKGGNDIALVSDAGLPGISDPGEELVRDALEEGVTVTPLPGPNAALTALVVSGLSTRTFVFEGFLPSTRKARQEELKKLAQEKRTLIFYESPHRIRETLSEIYRQFGDRKIAVARELTKKFEEILRGSTREMIGFFAENEPKGEFTLIVEGAGKPGERKEDIWEISPVEQVAQLVAQGIHRKEAIKKVARLRGVSKREIYDEVIRGKEE